MSEAKAKYTRNDPWNSFSFRPWISLIWEISARKARQNAAFFGARLFPNHTTLSEFKDICYVKVFVDADSEKCCCPSVYIMHIHIHIHIKYIYLTWAPARPPPAEPSRGPCKVYVFVYVYAYVRGVRVYPFEKTQKYVSMSKSVSLMFVWDQNEIQTYSKWSYYYSSWFFRTYLK